MFKNFFENMQKDSGNKFFRTGDYFKKLSEKESYESINDINQIMEEFEDDFQELQTDMEDLMKKIEGDMSNFTIDREQDGQKIVIEWSSIHKSHDAPEELCSEVCDCCGGTTKIKVGGGGVCDYCRAPIGKYKK